MTSEESNGKMSSSETTRSPLVAKYDEIPQNVVARPIGEQEESLDEQNVSDNEETASAVNILPSEAAQILPMLHNLLLNNDIHRERLIRLIQLFDPTAEGTNADVNLTESEQIAREADLASQVHFLEQSVQKLEEEVENLKNLNAQLEEHIKSLTTSSDP